MSARYTLFVIAVCFISLAVGGILYTNYAIERSDRERCEDLAIELEFYRQSPPDNDLRQRRYDLYQRKWREHCT